MWYTINQVFYFGVGLFAELAMGWEQQSGQLLYLSPYLGYSDNSGVYPHLPLG